MFDFKNMLLQSLKHRRLPCLQKQKATVRPPFEMSKPRKSN